MHQRYIPTLHHLDHSAAFRCLWALEELQEKHGLEYHLKNYQRQGGIAPPELKKIFPLGKSPILTLESTREGESPPTVQILPGVLTEAQLILRFLSAEYGKGLWEPESELNRNRDLFFQGFATMTLIPKIDFPVLIESVISLAPFGFSALAGLLASPLLTFVKGELPPIFQILENALSEEDPWFAGSKFGLADFNVCWGVDMAWQRGYLDAAMYPKLKNWHDTVTARGGYRRALEKGNGYNLKTYGL